MIWSTVDTPSNYFNVVVSPSEVNFLAVASDGRTIYAVDIPNKHLYRSDDGGSSWNELSNYLLAAGAVLPAWNLALAPDNPSFIAVVTSAGSQPRSVFISTDGGQNWNDTNYPATANIGAIAVSPNYGNYDIAVGTRTGTGGGTIYTYKSTGITGAWLAQGFTGDVLAIKFSPGYSGDASIAILYANNSGTFFNTGIRDPNANTTNWDSIYAGNPPEIAADGTGTSPKASQVVTGDLELPLDFSGQSPSMCRAYISIDSFGGNPGIYRLDNNIVYQLMAAAPNKRVSSIAYLGTYMSGKLLVGEVLGDQTRATVTTWFTDAPNTCPATCWYAAEKPPTGAGASGYGNAQVSWSSDGSRAFCGTSSALLSNPTTWPVGYLNNIPLDEAAFSISRDSGKTWNQLSLIDTQISFLSDVAVSADSNTIYLASINNTGANFDSIWRSNGQPTGKSWERVLCLLSHSNDIILRTSNAANEQVIFLASRGTNDLRQSQDSGQIWRDMLPGSIVNDFCITTLNGVRYAYVLSGIFMRRGNVTSIVPQWSGQVGIELNAAHSIFATPTGVVIVGGDTSDSRVSFSSDNGVSFAVTPAIPMPGKVHAIADYRFLEGYIIYAASDSPGSDIYNYVSNAGAAWNEMLSPNQRFWGLAQMGTLYGATNKLASAAVDRTLNPESLGPPEILWDVLDVGLVPDVLFTREPVSLKLSSGVNIWAIDNRPFNLKANTGRLWNFCDCLSPGSQYTPPPPPTKEELFASPTLVSPGPDSTIPVYLEDNSIGDITFQWKHKTLAKAYELMVASDSDFNRVIIQKIITPRDLRSPQWTLTDKSSLIQGETYYWKVRVTQAATGEKDMGNWSTVFSFKIAKGESKMPATPPPPNSISDNSPAESESSAPTSKAVIAEDKTRSPDDILNWIQGNLWILLFIVLLVICIVIAIIIGRKLTTKM